MSPLQVSFSCQDITKSQREKLFVLREENAGVGTAHLSIYHLGILEFVPFSSKM